jgi:hypothetical protein
MTWYSWDGRDLILRLRIQPKASQDAFIAPYGEDCYKVTITSPPIDGKANEHLIRFLAKQFGLPRSMVSLEAGSKSRTKSIRLKSPTRMPIALEDSADRSGNALHR